MDIKITCWKCNHDYTITCNHDDYNRWKYNNELIQEAMPYLSDDDRELLISKTCGQCWNDMFTDNTIED